MCCAVFISLLRDDFKFSILFKSLYKERNQLLSSKCEHPFQTGTLVWALAEYLHPLEFVHIFCL